MMSNLPCFKPSSTMKRTKGVAVHGQAVCACGCGETGFAFACQGGIEAEEALVVVRIDEDGVERGRILLAGADHLSRRICFSAFS